MTGAVLFGSLARGEGGPGSDVDLLVEGLDGERFFEACAAASRVMGGVEIDLVPRAWAQPEVLQRALREGRRLRLPPEGEELVEP